MKIKIDDKVERRMYNLIERGAYDSLIICGTWILPLSHLPRRFLRYRDSVLEVRGNIFVSNASFD